MILQCAVLFAFLALGELTVWLTGVPVPSSIIGMLFLAASLKAGWVRLESVDKVADFLVRNLGFFFVPAGVGVMRWNHTRPMDSDSRRHNNQHIHHHSCDRLDTSVYPPFTVT